MLLIGLGERIIGCLCTGKLGIAALRRGLEAIEQRTEAGPLHIATVGVPLLFDIV
jgi:hypothetical protein